MKMRVSRSILAHESITARNGMVIAQHPLGAQAGYNVLAQGGNAVDVAVTTAFVMGVVQPLMNGIGGGGQMVIRMGDGSVGAVDYGVRASGDASDDMYELIEGQEPLGPATLRVSSRYNWPLVEDNAGIAQQAITDQNRHTVHFLINHIVPQQNT